MCLLVFQVLESIFLNIRELLSIQREFYRDLKELRSYGADHLVANVSTAINRLAPKLQAYNIYVKHQNAANTELHRLRRKNTGLDEFLTLTEVAEETTLNSLLIMPVQRGNRKHECSYCV